MTSRPRSAARRPGLGSLNSTRRWCRWRSRAWRTNRRDRSDALQVLAGARFAANFGQMRGGRFSGNAAVSSVGRGQLLLRIVLAASGWRCNLGRLGSAHSRVSRWRGHARAETEAGRGRSGEDVKLCALLQAGPDVDAVTHAGDHVLQQMRRPGRRWRPGSAREPAPPVRTQGCMCCQRSSSSTVVSRCRGVAIREPLRRGSARGSGQIPRSRSMRRFAGVTARRDRPRPGAPRPGARRGRPTITAIRPTGPGRRRSARHR